MKIRRTLPADTDQLATLFSLGLEAFDGAPAILRVGNLEELSQRARDGNLLVAEDDAGRVVGMVSFVINGELYCGTNVAVLTESRGRGIGRDLILAAHVEAKERGAKMAMAVHWNLHSWLEDFYKSAGYVPVAQLMTKEL